VEWIPFLKKDYGIQDKKLILGVASIWGERKGLNDFIELSKILNPSKFQIVLVGLSDSQLRWLSKNRISILGLPRTNSPQKLAEIYTAADIFVNPTYEDNYPTVNLEAEACGTKVITYNTGGCSETISRNDSTVIEPGVMNLYKLIQLAEQ